MRKELKATIILCMLLAAVPVWSKMKCTPLYIFGTATSFNDSLVYITGIQILDSAWIEDKNDFLVKRYEYSNQLRNHFTQQGKPTRTCFVTFATKEKDILKKYSRLRKKLNGTKKHPTHYEFREMDEDEFQFYIAQPDVINEETVSMSKKDKKRAGKLKDKKTRGNIKKNINPNTDDKTGNTPPAMPPRH